MTTSYLRHTATGDIYPFNPDLALRDDMVEYVPTASELKAGTVKKKRGSRKPADGGPANVEPPETEQGEPDDLADIDDFAGQ